MLVNQGRLELLAAGWSSHDEACPTYEEFIANMMAGHQFVLREFGVTPKVGWQLDPFGHSSTSARLYAEMGLDGLIFARLDAQEKGQRMMKKSLEYIWRPSFDTLGHQSQIFSHIIYDNENIYSPPYGFNFNQDDSYNSFIDDENSPDYNAPQKSVLLLNHLLTMKERYRSNQLLITMGEDFAF